MHFSNNPNIQKELKDFSDQIETVSSATAKEQLNKMFNQLVREIRELESHHMQLTVQHQLPTNIADTRSKITDLRKSIFKKLKDWAEAQQS
jgi:predicted  nucleic acid-binding Zn-ribbon protein